jgi:hypothetical protein
MHNANNILFRCSSLGHIMVDCGGITEKQLKTIAELSCKPKLTDNQKETLANLILKRDTKPELSTGIITHLIDVFVSNKYNRFTEIKGKQLDKGNDTEEDSITVVSRITKKFFKKNEEHLKNDFICGTPDLFEGKDIYNAEIIRDTKSSWDVYTFNRAKFKELKEHYKWQGTGYMALTGATKCFIDYCLNNTPYSLINKELHYESYNHAENNTPAWIELQIIANHVYDKKTFDEYISIRGINIEDENAMAIYHGFVEIPLEERHFCFEFERNEDDIKALYNRIEDCREYMNEHLFKCAAEIIEPEIEVLPHDYSVQIKEIKTLKKALNI